MSRQPLTVYLYFVEGRVLEALRAIGARMDGDKVNPETYEEEILDAVIESTECDYAWIGGTLPPQGLMDLLPPKAQREILTVCGTSHLSGRHSGRN